MAWVHRHRAQLDLAVRVVTASLVTYGLGEVLGLQQSQWAVLTSVIVMQASVGASLKAMLDRFVGTLGGGIGGVVVILGLHGQGVFSPGLALALGLPPLALLAALKPSYRVAPLTFIILLMSPNLQALGPVSAGLERLFEIGVGSVVALVVSLVVLPAHAQDALVKAVAQALGAMAELMTALPEGIDGGADLEAVQAAHDQIRQAITKAEVAADEVLRERASRLTGAADPLPICRTLRRLRHDLAILGRTMAAPLPDLVAGTMRAPIRGVSAAIAQVLEDAAARFAGGGVLQGLGLLDAAFAAQSHAVTEIRRDGLTRVLSDDELSRLFGLGFALEQLRRDLQDLVDRGAELAR